MLFMVIERYTHGPEPIYRRAAEKGRMLPDGLRYVDSWIVDDGALDRCFQLMETDDPTPVRRVARELARPRRLRSAPRHQVVRRRPAGRRDVDGRALSVSHPGRAARPRVVVGRRGRRRGTGVVVVVARRRVRSSSASSGQSSRPRSSWSPGLSRPRSSVVVVSAGGIDGRRRRLRVRDRSAGEQCGDDVGDECSAGPGGGEVDVHRVDVRRRVVGGRGVRPLGDHAQPLAAAPLPQRARVRGLAVRTGRFRRAPAW